MRREHSRIVEGDWGKEVERGKRMLEESHSSNNVVSVYGGIATILANMYRGHRGGYGGKHSKYSVHVYLYYFEPYYDV